MTRLKNKRAIANLRKEQQARRLQHNGDENRDRIPNSIYVMMRRLAGRAFSPGEYQRIGDYWYSTK